MDRQSGSDLIIAHGRVLGLHAMGIVLGRALRRVGPVAMVARARELVDNIEASPWHPVRRRIVELAVDAAQVARRVARAERKPRRRWLRPALAPNPVMPTLAQRTAATLVGSTRAYGHTPPPR